MNKEKWIDYGESSLTLLAVHCGIDKANPSYPRDKGDFKRCLHLFECLNFGKGEIFSLLCITSDIYPIWKPFKDNWDELTIRFNEGNNFYKLIGKCMEDAETAEAV